MELVISIFTELRNYKSHKSIKLSETEVEEMLAAYLKAEYLQDNEELIGEPSISEFKP